MLCGSRLSPMEKRGKCWRSSTSTERPAFRSNAAAIAPDGPAPMMATSTSLPDEPEIVFNTPSSGYLHWTASCAPSLRPRHIRLPLQWRADQQSTTLSRRGDHMSPSETSHVPFVPETAFGIWFLRTRTWEHHVLRVAINDLKRLIDAPLPVAPVIVDVGCGQGISFRLLAEAFKPERIVGIDFHRPSLQAAASAAHACRPTGTDIELLHGDCANLPLPDASADIVF